MLEGTLLRAGGGASDGARNGRQKDWVTVQHNPEEFSKRDGLRLCPSEFLCWSPNPQHPRV